MAFTQLGTAAARHAGGKRQKSMEEAGLKVTRYADGEASNFGDDLNRWMWSRISAIPLDVDDGTLLLGIGTVISRSMIPPADRYIVLSSGVGYDALPPDFGGSKWEVLAVRGPLTAEVLNLPQEKAIVDGAVLLRLLPECEPLPESERAGIGFMPHYDNLPDGNWREVCALAGFEFLDPLADSEETVQRIRRTKLVIADAMHAAIVADALRVPWIPVTLSPQSNTFKWLDWTLSLDLAYRPTAIPPSTLLESVRNQSLRFYGPNYYVADCTPASALLRYRQVMRLKAWKYWPAWRRRAKQVTYSLPSKLLLSSAFSWFRNRQDVALTRRAAAELQKAAELPSYLSEEKRFASRLAQLSKQLCKLQPWTAPSQNSDGGSSVQDEWLDSSRTDSKSV
jgi:succinoglycan biosynthesis protein ExoV